MKVMSNNRAKLNSILHELAEDSSLNYEKTATLMSMAAKIDDALKAKGMSQKEFASKMGKQPSVVSKWLSGTHNFTADTLMDIQSVLDIELIKREERSIYHVAKASKAIRSNNNWLDINNSSVSSLAFC